MSTLEDPLMKCLKWQGKLNFILTSNLHTGRQTNFHSNNKHEKSDNDLKSYKNRAKR